LTLLSKRDSGFLLDGLHNHCGKQNQKQEMMSCHLIWLLSVKLGSWSCQLWYQHPSRGCWLFCQNKIQVFCLRVFIIIARNRISGERWCLAIWFDCSSLNWDSGLVNCGTNILHGCWLFLQNEIQFIAGNLTILLWETLSAGRGNILPFDWVKSHVPCCLWFLCGENWGECMKVS
jgi:hypothetical protein